MSRNYKFHDPKGMYFVTYSVINWIDIFIRNEYRDVMLDSWKHCIDKKGLEIFGWCIMTSHAHMIIASNKDLLENIMRDMKRHTSTTLRHAIENSFESRKTWIMEIMMAHGTLNKHNKDFQFWQQHNHPILLDTNHIMQQKLDYIHMNPVEAGFVDEPEHYLYSSARDYSGKKGLIDISFIE
ncbi:MAG: transposase [Bacteroidetes bacterium]|nr:transposase [Bacteroidota bacterium]